MSPRHGNPKMHNRNPYKHNPPSFQKLAEKYTEFRKFCTIHSSGKVCLNFKNHEAVRCLTTVLFKEDFGLEVEIPADNLVPRIPQRLNYLLWLQDLLEQNRASLSLDGDTPITGLDIGTGASCVYPLLGAKKYGWHFLATDKEESAVACARRNVAVNGLGGQIEILKVGEDTALLGALEGRAKEGTLHFSMCNPPFYDVSELSEDERGCVKCIAKVSSRNARPPPPSESRAQRGEVCANGGELAFVGKIIEDSLLLGQRVKVYSSMIGKKANLAPLKLKLEAAGAKSVALTVFHQGKTQRWALAWTFDPRIHLHSTTDEKLEASLEKPPKLKKPLRFVLPESCNLNTVEQATARLLSIIDQLSIRRSLEESGAYRCVAARNTWSNQRRKRRAEKLLGGSSREAERNGEPPSKLSRLEEREERSAPAVGSGSVGNGEGSPVLEFLLRVEESGGGVAAVLEFVSGQNKDSLNQILQFVKNVLSSTAGSSEKADVPTLP